MMKWWWLVALAFTAGCTCAELPDAVFQCESDGTCGQPGFVCGDDGLCRMPTMVGNDAGHDAGTVDAGEVDAGSGDAGTDDAGIDDAGFDAGMDDAGFDAGMDDAGVDAGMDDAGMNDAGVDAGCVPTGAIDEPDQSQADVDCDGFDGDLSRAVFVDPVGGLDTNAGTRALPKQTLGGALATSQSQIYLATGTYAVVAVNDAVSVFGGYTPSGDWPRTTTRSILTGSLVAHPVDAGQIVFERLTVNGADGVTTGEAAVALTLINAASSSRLTDLSLVAGTGSAGANGTSPAAVATGNVGNVGFAGDAGAAGGTGGSGANCGDAGFSFAGFVGGAGATTSSGRGADGGDSTLGGIGALAVVCDGGPCVGLDGGIGLDGVDGTMSAARVADPPNTFLGTVLNDRWVGASLGTWAPSSSGRAGGGGGGGGGLLDLTLALIARGGGAGGGGSGGCGGRSGTAGQAGGASIGVLLINSSPRLRNVSVITTGGGRGGDGAVGVTGGLGGNGGSGAGGEPNALGIAGAGARGGRGGRGGTGRQGPGGWGGPLIGVFCFGGAAPDLDASTTWTMMGTAGASGAGDPVGLVGGQPSSGLSSGCP